MFDYTLTPYQLAELRHQHKLCKKRKDADKVKAVYLLGKGWSMTDVCEALLLEDDAIRRYFMTYKQHGLQALLTTKYAGKMSFLTETKQRLLEKHLREHTYARVTEIIGYVSDKFGIVYSDSGMRFILKQLGFVYKKPEKIPYRVDEKAQKNFIKQYKKIKQQLGIEDSIYFMDATHPEHTAVPSYGWIKRGETKVLPSNPRPNRLNINGAINIETLDMVVRFEEKINKETTLDFLEALRKKQTKGWIYLFCDNAGYYQSPDVRLYAESLAIKLIYLPAYCPNLNLIERIWKFFKKKVLYNTYYDNFSEMIIKSKKFFREIRKYRDELKTLMTENFQIITC